MISPNARLFLIACIAMAVGAVGYLVYYLFLADALPDAASLEAVFASMVADGDTVARATRMLTRDGFECGLVAAETTGTWHCDLAERVPTDEFDCPRRIMVALIPDDDGRLANFSVLDGAFCM